MRDIEEMNRGCGDRPGFAADSLGLAVTAPAHACNAQSSGGGC